MANKHRGLGPNAAPFKTREDHMLAFQLYRSWQPGCEKDAQWLRSQAAQLNNSTVFHDADLQMRVPAQFFLFLVDAAQRQKMTIPSHVLDLVSGAKTIVMCAGGKTPVLVSLEDTVHLLEPFLPNIDFRTVDFFEQWKGL